MLETELKKEIKKLSDNYSFAEIDSSSITGPRLLVYYKGNMVLRIYNNMQYLLEVTIERSDFYRLPFSNKLWMLAAEFAMTPVDKRFSDCEYKVDLTVSFKAPWYLNKKENFDKLQEAIISNIKEGNVSYTSVTTR